MGLKGRLLLCLSFLGSELIFHATAGHALPPVHLFPTRTVFPARYAPDFVVLGDVNGDGVLDAVTNASLVLGNGRGGFRGPVYLETGGEMAMAALGDVNGDGAMDVVAANESTIPYSSRGCIGVLLGNGNGTFQSPWLYTAGREIRSVALGDVNRDGHLDIVAVGQGYGGYDTFVFLGNGSGAFLPVAQYLATGDSGSVVLEDLNGDRNLDMVIREDWFGGVVVYLGKGDGTFWRRAILHPPAYGSSLALGDLDGDGHPDLVVSALHSDQGQCYVSVFMGNGNGTFRAGPQYPMELGSTWVSVVDLDGDGLLDVAVTDGDAVRLFHGNGDGSLLKAASFSAGDSPEALAVGDLNRDGALDLAVADYGRDYRPGISVLLGRGDGSLLSGVDYALPAGRSLMALGDLNRDGDPDMAVSKGGTTLSCGSGCEQFVPGCVSVLLSNGDGTFRDAVNYQAGRDPFVGSLTDLDHDGNLDILVFNRPDYDYTDTGCLRIKTPVDVSVLPGRGDGTFQNPVSSTIGGLPFSFLPADLDGDGNLDLAITNMAYCDADTQEYHPPSISVMMGLWDGTFGEPADYQAGESPWAVTVSDVDRDGNPDLIVVDQGSWYDGAGLVLVLSGNGDGTFQEARSYDAGGEPFSMLLGDLNRDSFPDLVLPDEGSVLLGDGQGGFRAPVSYGVSGYPGTAALGDVNADGILDIAVCHYDEHHGKSVSVLLGNGDGTFGTKDSHEVGHYPSTLFIEDIDGDGRPDIVLMNSDSDGSLQVLLGNGDGSFQGAATYLVEDGLTSLVVADLNGDGALDLAAASEYNVTVFLNQRSYGFLLLTPFNDSDSYSPPRLEWTSGGCPLFVLYSAFYYPGIGYYPVSFLTRSTSFELPPAWWDLISPNVPSYWAVLGWAGPESGWQVAGPWWFWKYGR